jgi:hypothetical protein
VYIVIVRWIVVVREVVDVVISKLIGVASRSTPNSETQSPSMSGAAMVREGFQLRYFWVAALPLAALLYSDVTLGAWASKFDGNASLLKNSSIEARVPCALNEAAGRIHVLSTVTMVVMLSIVAVAFFVRQALSLFLEPRDVKSIFAVFGIYIGVGLGLVFLPLGPSRSQSLDIYGPWMKRVAETLPGEPASLVLLETLHKIMNVSLIFGIAAIVAGSVCCLFYPACQHCPFHWRTQLSRAQRWLYFAAALLICGLLFHRAWGAWIGSCLDAQFVSAAHGRLVSAFTGYRAVQYSVFLAAFYVPVIFVLNGQAEQIALAGDKPGPNIDLVKRRKRRGLDIPVVEMGKAFGGMIAPFAVGLLGPLADLSKAMVG